MVRKWKVASSHSDVHNVGDKNMYEHFTDQQLYEFYLTADEETQEEIERLERFEAYVRERDYTVWRRTQPEVNHEEILSWAKEHPYTGKAKVV